MARDFSDGISSSDTSWVSASAAFGAADAGIGISGSNIPNGTTIVSVTNPTTVVLSHATTDDGEDLSFHLERPASTIATVDDLQARLVRHLSDAEQARAAVLLADADAAIKARARQIFVYVADDTVRLRPIGDLVRLPQRPVTAVSAVVDLDGNDIPFVWAGADQIRLWPNTGTGFCDVPPSGRVLVAVDVTYSHGYTEMPAELVGLECQMAARAFGVPADQAGESSRNVDGYVTTVGAAAAAGAGGMLASEEKIVDRYRRRTGTLRQR